MLQQLKNSLEAGGRQEWGFHVKWGMGCSPYTLVKGQGWGDLGEILFGSSESAPEAHYCSPQGVWGA